jgi:hypothetical protein
MFMGVSRHVENGGLAAREKTFFAMSQPPHFSARRSAPQYATNAEIVSTIATPERAKWPQKGTKNTETEPRNTRTGMGASADYADYADGKE